MMNILKRRGDGRTMIAADIGCEMHPYGEYAFYLTIRHDMRPAASVAPMTTQEETEALEPCPFCGGPGTFEYGGGLVAAYCRNDCPVAPCTNEALSESEAASLEHPPSSTGDEGGAGLGSRRDRRAFQQDR
jgi:hypothetical protein